MIKQIQLNNSAEYCLIPGFNGKYSATKEGVIRSNIAYGGKGKVLGQHVRNGYCEVNLFDEKNIRNSHRVHRLIVETFIGPIPDNMQVNHINGIKTDNRLCNLEIVTPSENCLHAFRTGLSKPTDNRLKKSIVASKNGTFYSRYPSIRELCRALCLDRRSVQRTIAGKWSQYKGFTFAYD